VLGTMFTKSARVMAKTSTIPQLVVEKAMGTCSAYRMVKDIVAYKKMMGGRIHYSSRYLFQGCGFTKKAASPLSREYILFPMLLCLSLVGLHGSLVSIETKECAKGDRWRRIVIE
jgi:hypothetical protein